MDRHDVSGRRRAGPPPMLRFQRPSHPSAGAIERHFARSREARWFSNGGPCARELATRLASRVADDVHAVPVASGTAALLVALCAVDAVSRARSGVAARPLAVMPSYTFVATAQAALWGGMTPLFVDVDRDGWQLDVGALRDALDRHGGEVAVVLACSTFGVAPAPETRRGWEQAASEHDIPLVVDSAAGFGSMDAAGRPLGCQGDAETFSFHATKPLAIGEGGAVLTTDADRAARLRRVANFGFDEGREVTEAFGLNAKLSELHAATGLAALESLDEALTARRSHAQRIRAALEPAGFAFQAGADGSTWQFVPVLAGSARRRDAVIASAAGRGVEIRTYHRPLHRMRCFADAPIAGPLAVTDDLAARGLSLPMAVDLTDAEIDALLEAVLT